MLFFVLLLSGLYLFSFYSSGWTTPLYECELYPERLVLRYTNRWRIQRATSIPKAWIRSIRVVLSPGNAETSDTWNVEVVWANQKALLLPAWTIDKTTAQRLGTTIGLWSELRLAWQNSSGVERLYHVGATPAVVQPTRPRLTVVDISEGWQTTIVALLLLGLFTLIYVEWTDWLFLVLGLSITGLFLFGLLLKLLLITLLTPRFQQEGVATQGVITQRWIDYAPEPKKDQCWLAYQFPEGVETKVKVKPALYAAHQGGDPVQIAYLSTDPHISFVEVWLKP